MNCPECNSELEQFAGRYGTGVLAPDGYGECVWEEGFYCPRCVRVIGNDEFRQRLADVLDERQAEDRVMPQER